ncbi:MAG: hypothetical protein KDB16_06045 [Acidimicrobiales bacterium]|nr:hypothetical protein [Acidimicrobiales bacterium]
MISRIRAKRRGSPNPLVGALAIVAALAASCSAVTGGDGVVDARAGLPTTTAPQTTETSPGAGRDGATPTSSDDLDIPLTTQDRPTTTESTDQAPPADVPEPVTTPPPSAGAWGEVVVLIESFWDENFTQFAGSGSFEPLDRDRIVAVSDQTRDLPACDLANISARDVEDNAFAAVCPEGQLVVWDDDDLFAELFDQYGVTGPTVVLAHEMGHAAQFQAGFINNPTLILEQQADCVAGAYAAWAAERSIAPFDTAAGLDAAVGATVSFRDHPGSSAADSQAHGSGFDRVRAFQDGFDRGVGYCAQYPELSLPITEFPFSTFEEAQSGGNLPFNDLISLVSPYLNSVYADLNDDWQAMELSAGDLDGWRNAHRSIGDNATGTAMGLMFAKRHQVLNNLPSEGEGALLQQACLTGAAFAPLVFFDERISPDNLSLSPGDMDEAVLTMIRIVETNQDRLGDGFLFEAVAALRTGFTEGFDSCDP